MKSRTSAVCSVYSSSLKSHYIIGKLLAVVQIKSIVIALASGSVLVKQAQLKKHQPFCLFACCIYHIQEEEKRSHSEKCINRLCNIKYM